MSEDIEIDINGFRCRLPKDSNKDTVHFCLKHNCPYWVFCPICGYEDLAISDESLNPSRRDDKNEHR